MRKLLFLVLLVTSTTWLFAQKLDDVQEKFSKGKIDEAKEKIDKLLSDPKNQKNASAWYWKGKVYTELARLDSTGTLPYNAAAEAFDAYKKYQQLDPKNVLMTIEQNVGLFQLYDLHYNKGIKFYNDKDYPKAYEKMKDAMDVEEYVAGKGFVYNGFSFPKLDTQLVNLTASAAYLANKHDEAMPYFEKLADAKIKEKEYRDIYALLAEYYAKKGDQAKADKYLNLGKELFPDNDYWLSMEFGEPGKEYKDQIDQLNKDLDKATTDADKKAIQAKITPLEEKMNAERFARYDQLLQKYPGNYPLAMDYAIELFNYTYTFDKKPSDYLQRQEKLQTVLKTAVDAKSTPIANFVMSQHLYNQIYDLEDAQRAVKGTTAADQAKKKDISAKINAKYEEMYVYAQKAYDLYTAETTLKAQDKANLRKVIDELVDYYSKKKQQDKVNFYQQKLKSL